MDDAERAALNDAREQEQLEQLAAYFNQHRKWPDSFLALPTALKKPAIAEMRRRGLLYGSYAEPLY